MSSEYFTHDLTFTNPSTVSDQIFGIFVESAVEPFVVIDDDDYLNKTISNGSELVVPMNYTYKCVEYFNFTLNV